MLNENAKKWVAALRSGEWKQCQGKLQAGDAYCCLGVAARLWLLENPGSVKWTGRNATVLPDGKLWGAELGGQRWAKVRDWLGLSDALGRFIEDHPAICALGRAQVMTSLVEKNDSDGASFLEIADIIESEPEGLFKAPVIEIAGGEK